MNDAAQTFDGWVDREGRERVMLTPHSWAKHARKQYVDARNEWLNQWNTVGYWYGTAATSGWSAHIAEERARSLPRLRREMADALARWQAARRIWAASEGYTHPAKRRRMRRAHERMSA